MQRTTMRQTTLPLAGSLVLCCAIGAPAHAQNNPTLYGLMDAGVGRLNNVSTGGSHTGTPRIPPSAASRWGLRGSEDLGNGLKAVFTLESGFGSDNGALQQGGRAFGRKAFVGLSGSWGKVTQGRK